MQLNDTIIDQIKKVCEEEGQPSDIAERLIAWMEALVKGNVNLDYPNARRKLEEIYEKVQVES